MSGNARSAPRSGCPVGLSLDLLGDRWSLLVVRDLMVLGLRTFREFQASAEGIATNILSDRLHRLEENGIITGEPEENDARRIIYRLTEKGVDLAPVLLDLLVWGARHEKSSVPAALRRRIEADREGLLAEVRRRWREDDRTPLFPDFGSKQTRKSGGRKA
jgi:DNA-binding HxlR family transcriptional regulator